ncbi:dihydropteroate synthase [Salinadaptatus halalkaliphilus]|uniref:dihydropteroate synthase n=1 Tax=Salinadaptatus halalkaliphilus TaxID=2419781 RepID=A0A4S3TKW1_9EURY|nr:dihydropteroate synthase [Salinadaptatus halalkaliphilus]THE64789.1 dihydropteroate synthase [Salinadaptatus halalkaliphilus]
MNGVDAAGLGIGGGNPPRIMGVLNVSEESPYDPSVYDDPGDAARYVDKELIDEGADIVDIGLESANKRFDVLTAEAELERLHVALETIESVSGDAIFSIETRYAEVAEAALSQGFDMVNDICGFADPEMPEVCREYDVAVGKMASPPDLTRPGAVEETDWAGRKSTGWAAEADYVDQVYEALKQHGLTEKTIVDPAFGGWSEAQTVADDRKTFHRLGEFRVLGQPILVSINRKNFLGDLVDRETDQRLAASLAATSMAVERGADVIRTHDVAETRDAALIGDAFADSSHAISDSVSVSRLEVRSPRALRRQLRERGIDPAVADECQPIALDIDGLSIGERRHIDALVTDRDASWHTVTDHSGLLVGSVTDIRDISRGLREEYDSSDGLRDALAELLQ